MAKIPAKVLAWCSGVPDQVTASGQAAEFLRLACFERGAVAELLKPLSG